MGDGDRPGDLLDCRLRPHRLLTRHPGLVRSAVSRALISPPDYWMLELINRIFSSRFQRLPEALPTRCHIQVQHRLLHDQRTLHADHRLVRHLLLALSRRPALRQAPAHAHRDTGRGQGHLQDAERQVAHVEKQHLLYDHHHSHISGHIRRVHHHQHQVRPDSTSGAKRELTN